MNKIRINPMGMTYILRPNGGKTRIELHISNAIKHIIVDMNIEEMSQAWYDWMIKGEYVQTAFKKLSDDQREFLLTGLTPEEWDEMFNEEER